jgi:hypothetical protein
MVLSAERAPLFHLYDDLLLFLVSGHDDPPCLDRFPKARAVKFANKNYITKTENDSECCWIEQLFLDWTLNTGSYRLESSPELVVGCILRLLRLFFIDLILTRRSCKVHTNSAYTKHVAAAKRPPFILYLLVYCQDN